MADRHEWFLNQIFRHRAALQRYLQRFTSGAEAPMRRSRETSSLLNALVARKLRDPDWKHLRVDK